MSVPSLETPKFPKRTKITKKKNQFLGVTCLTFTILDGKTGTHESMNPFPESMISNKKENVVTVTNPIYKLKVLAILKDCRKARYTVQNQKWRQASRHLQLSASKEVNLIPRSSRKVTNFLFLNFVIVLLPVLISQLKKLFPLHLLSSGYSFLSLLLSFQILCFSQENYTLYFFINFLFL